MKKATPSTPAGVSFVSALSNTEDVCAMARCLPVYGQCSSLSSCVDLRAKVRLYASRFRLQKAGPRMDGPVLRDALAKHPRVLVFLSHLTSFASSKHRSISSGCALCPSSLARSLSLVLVQFSRAFLLFTSFSLFLFFWSPFCFPFSVPSPSSPQLCRDA